MSEEEKEGGGEGRRRWRRDSVKQKTNTYTHASPCSLGMATMASIHLEQRDVGGDGPETEVERSRAVAKGGEEEIGIPVVHVHVCMYMCMYVYMCVYVYAYVCMYMYVRMYVCMPNLRQTHSPPPNMNGRVFESVLQHVPRMR